MTIPLDEQDEGVLEAKIGNEQLQFKGRVKQTDKIKLATFDLPALSRAELTAR